MPFTQQRREILMQNFAHLLLEIFHRIYRPFLSKTESRRQSQTGTADDLRQLAIDKAIKTSLEDKMYVRKPVVNISSFHGQYKLAILLFE